LILAIGFFYRDLPRSRFFIYIILLSMKVLHICMAMMQIMHLRYMAPTSKIAPCFGGVAIRGSSNGLPLTPLCNSFKELFKELTSGSFFLSAIFTT
ncbi:MAG: hypothetical protein ACPH3D_05030, partial [Porticoccaceae bacterium]